ncbi:MAG: DUF2461 domain-containing protein [Lysobacteraceae bacterium]|nr:MAG: DUF2461 domain-containing protein [Xanthomonadaceae bacterium]
MSVYFTDRSFKFLRGLARHNNRTWFHAHKSEYDAHVRTPFQSLLTDLQPVLREVSAHYRSEPKTIGGSLFRIQRDTRFSGDKAPYKSWQGARLFHVRGRDVEAPSFYLQLQPGNCFIGAGLWHPEPETLRRVRQFIVDNPGSWSAAAHAAAFRKRFDLDDSEMLTRPPRGYPADAPHLDDLRRKNYVAWRSLDDATLIGPRLLAVVGEDLRRLAPFADYLCAALDLEF